MDRFQIRPVTEAAGLLQYKKLACCLFRSPDRSLTDEEAYGTNAEEERRNAPEGDILLGAYDGDQLCGGMRLLPYTVWLSGKPVRMCGIGGVISSPAYAGCGVVRELFREAFRLMKEQDRPVSHLFPFEMQYYRQYGYEVSCSQARWRIPVRSFLTKGDGQIFPYDNSDTMKNDIRRIYDTFARRYSFMPCRSELDWVKFFDSHSAYTSGMFSYLHASDGVADAFLSYRTQPNDDRPQDLDVPTLWFSTLSGLRGLLGYFRTQIPYADYVNIVLPQDVDLSAVIECAAGWGKRHTEAAVSFSGTSRAVDILSLLQGASVPYPTGGSVTVRISGDTYCPWNNGLYTVPLSNPTGTFMTCDASAVPDIELTPNGFAAMFFGRYDLDSCAILPDVRIHGNAERLRSLFCRKSCFIDIHF